MDKLEVSIEQLRIAYREYEDIFITLARSCGVSGAEYQTLLLVSEGIATQTQISERLMLSKQTINSACMKLIKRGYIRLATTENNLREKKIFFTEEGSAFVRENIYCFSEAEEWAWNELSPQEQCQLLTLTRKVNDNMKLKLQNRSAKQ